MSLYVLKFGGSSVAGIERMKHVAGIVSKFVKKSHKVVVVTSAMHGETDKLVLLSKSISVDIDREYDAIISCGEQIAAGMLARTLQTTGIPAQSLSACQIPIFAEGSFGNASITNINTEKITKLLNSGIVAVVTGFQGINNNGDVITLGRGGSDATACALSYYINADECYIYTDVDGIYTGDPRIAINAKLIPEISYDEMFELSLWGAKVLQYQSVEIAKKYNVKVRVLSSFSSGDGTLITENISNDERIIGVTHSVNYNLVATSKKYVNFMKVDSNIYLTPKEFNIEGGVNVDVGTITVVGRGVHKMTTKFLNILKSVDIVPKFTIQRKLSVTFVVRHAQVERGVNAVLDYVF